jgi:hypothetical protein
MLNSLIAAVCALVLSGCLTDFDRFAFQRNRDAGSVDTKTNSAPGNSLAPDAGTPDVGSGPDASPNASATSGTEADSSATTSTQSDACTRTFDSQPTETFLEFTKNSDLEVLRGVAVFNRGIIVHDGVDDLSALRCLTQLFGLYVEGNSALTSLDDLAQLRSVSFTLQFLDNTALTSLSGLEGVSGELPGGLRLKNNSQLVNIAALRGVTRAGALQIVDNPRLTALVGLEGVTTVGLVADDPLEVGTNATLTTLTALDGVTSLVDIRLWVHDNPKLVQLGFAGLVQASDVTIENNSQLPGCQAYELQARLESNGSIMGNGPLTSECL